ncbi:MAG TPA: hypothetical protein VHG92_09620 [Afifellaceae bacterium]|nr:hypothetical protein [Afifellaceae bacterium]
MSDSPTRAGRSGRIVRATILALVALVAVALFVFLVVIPELAGWADVAFAPGVGLRTAAVISFFLTVALFVLLALVAGDGLLGELEVMIAAFFGFFTSFWLLIAWLF